METDQPAAAKKAYGEAYALYRPIGLTPWAIYCEQRLQALNTGQRIAGN